MPPAEPKPTLQPHKHGFYGMPACPIREEEEVEGEDEEGPSERHS